MQILVAIVAGFLLLVTIGQTLIQFAFNLGAGYHFIPDWFGGHVWIVAIVFLLSWTISPRRQWSELVAFSALLIFPFMLFIISGGQSFPIVGSPSAMVNEFRNIGQVFAYATTTLVLAYLVHAVTVRFWRRNV